MKRIFFTFLALAFIAASAWAQTAAIYGTLVRVKSDQTEGWKDSPNTAGEYFVVRFEKPFETEHSNWENENGKNGKVRITEMQVIYFGEKADLKGLIGKKVIAEGGLMERNTMHHATPLLLSVEPGHIKAGAFMLMPEAPAEESAPAAGKGTE
jgi:hypothetical protein